MTDAEREIEKILEKESDPLHAALRAARMPAYHRVRELMESCDSCPIGADCVARTLPASGDDPIIMVIGDFPTKYQDSKGGAGTMKEGPEWDNVLGKALGAFQVDDRYICFMNAVGCSPYKEVNGKKIRRQPKSDEMSACKFYVDYMIQAVDPAVIILLGNYALNMFKHDRLNTRRKPL